MPDIECPRHTLLTAHWNIFSHPDADPVMEEEDNNSDDGHTLSDLKRKRGMTTSQGTTTSHGDEIFPAPPKKARMATQKCRAGASTGKDNDEQPR
jgi:hypothetical protein